MNSDTTLTPHMDIRVPTRSTLVHETKDSLVSLATNFNNNRAGCRNVSHCQQQQSYSGLRSPDEQTQPTFEMTPGFKPFTTKIMFVDSDVSYN